MSLVDTDKEALWTGQWSTILMSLVNCLKCISISSSLPNICIML